jgi:hypothetical protein
VITPNFFIAGAPKCGTTALFTYLRGHPDVFMCSIKEPQFFAGDILGDTRNVQTWNEYFDCFAEAGRAKIVGEASVAYLGSPGAPGAIKAFNPSAKIIIMLRNPVDMMHSLHSQRIFDNTERVASFEAALEADERRSCTRPPGLGYRDVARYEPQVQRYLDVFGRDNVLVILFDDLKSRTRAVYRDTLRFLDLNTAFQPELPVVNSNHRARSMRIHEFLRHPPQAFRKVIHTVTSQRVRKFVGMRLMRLNVAYEPRAPMDSALRARLLKEVAPEVEKLSRLLNRDLSDWCS